MYMTQGRPFRQLGEVDPDTGVDAEALQKASQDAKQLQTVLPTLPWKIGMSSLVWVGLIYWFLIRR